MSYEHDDRSSLWASESQGSVRPRRRWLIVLAAVAIMAIPAGLTSISHLWAQNKDTPALPIERSLSNKERLAKGIAEFKQAKYEEALTDLQQVNADILGDRDLKDLNDHLAKAEAAANQRRAARAEFEQGEEALAANDPVKASGHYKAARQNRYADEGTRAKADEQLKVVDAMMKGAGVSLKDTYSQAVTEYRAGDLEPAKAKFEQLVAAGYKAGLFQKSAGDYLADIDAKLAAPPPVQQPVAEQPVPQEPAVEQPPMPTETAIAEPPMPPPTEIVPLAPPAETAEIQPPAPQAETTIVTAPAEPAPIQPPPSEVAAEPTQPLPPRVPTAIAQPDAAAEPVLPPAERVVPPVQTTVVPPAEPEPIVPPAPPVETTIVPPPPPPAETAVVPPPTETAVVPPPAEAPIAQPADAMPTETAVVPPPPAETTEQAAEQPAAAEPAMDPKTAYRTARDEYRQGDWINARKNFELARDLGYEPGLFEDSPQRYLARMDAKERRDEQRAVAQAAAQPQAEPTTPPAEQMTAETPAEPAPEAPTAEQPAPPAPTADEMAALAAQAAEQKEAEQRQTDAQKLVDQAEASRAAYRLDEAVALYTRAAELDPANQSAVTALDSLKAEMAGETDRSDLLARREQQILQQQQYITYTFNNAIADAQRAIDEKNFAEAQAAVERARVARAANPGVFREEQVRQFDAAIAATQLKLDQASEANRLADAAAARDQSAAQLREQQRVIEEEKLRTVADLIRESRQLTSEGRFQQALGVIDQIIKLDPRNDYALGARQLVEDRAVIQQQRNYREQYDKNVVRHYNDAEEKKIPYSDILKFPENWPDLSVTRDKTVALERGERAEDAAVAAQLERRLPEVRFDNVGLADVVDFLRDVTSANIFVNWRALETSGIDRNSPVTARLRDVKFSKALETILRDVGGGTVRLSYTIDEGVISISTEEDLASNVVTQVYDIRDLIVNIPEFDNAPDLTLQSSSVGGGGGGANLFGGATGEEGEAVTRQELVDAIIALIQDTVASDSWRDSGGTIGSIRELGGQLIVTQTPENHRELSRLLAKLRETRAIQITVETRFLTVQRNFLEEVGVDFDITIPSGRLGNNIGPVGLQNNTATYTESANLSTGVPGSIADVLAANRDPTSGSPIPNFGINNGAGGPITFLDDFQVTLLLRATQIAQNTTTLTAPRITLFNGQRAWVVVSTDTAYVGDLNPITAAGAVAWDPQPAVVSSGVLLDVQATVSADRKYVTLTLRPVLSRLQDLAEFPVVSVTQPGTDTGGEVQVATATLQQPVVQNTALNTTVSVPDGGTLLLGGQTVAGEVERESGVPVLSKIPFLKRLFTNTGMAKDEQVLLILVKPTIIIQREREQEQFPLLSTKVGE